MSWIRFVSFPPGPGNELWITAAYSGPLSSGAGLPIREYRFRVEP